MSSEKQEASPEQRRLEIERFATINGYRILRWYVDEAISDDSTEQRYQFQQMIAAAESRELEAILYWNQDRFGKQWFRAPESLLEKLTAEADVKQPERGLVSQELNQAEAAFKPVDIEAMVEELAPKVWALAEELDGAKPARVRELMQQLVDRVDVAFTAKQNGKRLEHHPSGGQIVFREKSLGFVSRGDKTAIELFRRGVTTISLQLPIAAQGLVSLLSRSGLTSHLRIDRG